MIYIIIVNYNSWELTQNCILSLSNLEYDKFKVIVCDNASHDQSIEKLNQLKKCFSDDTLEILNTGSNLGFSGANNIGLRMALDDPQMSHVWLLNNDTTVDAMALKHLVSEMEANPHMGICGSTLLFSHDTTTIQAVGGKFNSWLAVSRHILEGHRYSRELCATVNAEDFDYIVGASMLVSRLLLEKIGLLDDQFFLYCEELDWATRAKQAGFKLGYAKDSIVYHVEGGTTGSASYKQRKDRSRFADECAQLSYIRYTKKHFPYRKYTVSAFFVVKALKRALGLDLAGAAIVVKSLFKK